MPWSVAVAPSSFRLIATQNLLWWLKHQSSGQAEPATMLGRRARGPSTSDSVCCRRCCHEAHPAFAHEQTKNPPCGPSCRSSVRPGRLELPRPKWATRPSTLRAACQIRPMRPWRAGSSGSADDLNASDDAFVATDVATSSERRSGSRRLAARPASPCAASDSERHRRWRCCFHAKGVTSKDVMPAPPPHGKRRGRGVEFFGGSLREPRGQSAPPRQLARPRASKLFERKRAASPPSASPSPSPPRRTYGSARGPKILERSA